jgi:hypothetical protein
MPNTRNDMLEILALLSSFICFPTEALNQIRKSGFSEFADCTDNYNREILRARNLYDELKNMKSFGYFWNSTSAWTYSISSIALKIRHYREQTLRTLQPGAGLGAFVKNQLISQAGISGMTPLIFITRKVNGKYVVQTETIKREVTLAQVCAMLPRPSIMSQSVCSLDSCDILTDFGVQENFSVAELASTDDIEQSESTIATHRTVGGYDVLVETCPINNIQKKPQFLTQATAIN